jgi:hypothetical protein
MTAGYTPQQGYIAGESRRIADADFSQGNPHAEDDHFSQGNPHAEGDHFAHATGKTCKSCGRIDSCPCPSGYSAGYICYPKPAPDMFTALRRTVPSAQRSRLLRHVGLRHVHPDGPVSRTRPATPTTSVTLSADARPETASMLHRCRLNSLDAPSMSFARARPGSQASQETRQPRETPLRLPACPEPDYMLRGRGRALARVMGRAGAPSPQEPLPLRPGRHPIGNRHTRRSRGRRACHINESPASPAANHKTRLPYYSIYCR